MRIIIPKTERWFLISVLVFSTILRILALNQHDFWFDEAITFYLAKLPLKNIFDAVLSDSNPPTYYLLMHFIAKFNQNEVFLRIPSAVAGLLTIPLIYFLTKKFTDSSTARSASILFAISPLSIYTSTEARLHSLSTLFAVAVAFIFLNLVEKLKPTSSILFVVITTIALYTHFYIALLYIPLSIIAINFRGLKALGIYNSSLHERAESLRLGSMYSLFAFIPAQIFNFWRGILRANIKFRKAKNVKKTLLLLSIPIIAFLPWVFFFLTSSHNDCSCPNSILSLPASLVSPSVAGVGIVSMRSFITLSPALIFIFTLTSLLTLLLFLRGVIRNIQIASIYLIPLTITTTAGLIFPVFSPKGFSIFSPFFFIIVAIGINSLILRRYINLLLIILLLAISVIQILNPLFKGEKLKLPFQVTQKVPDIPIAHSSLLTFYSFRFYSQDKTQNYLITDNPLSLDTQKYIGGKPYNVPELTSFWLADTKKWTEENTRENLLREIYKHYKEEEKYTFDQITLTYFKKQL